VAATTGSGQGLTGGAPDLRGRKLGLDPLRSAKGHDGWQRRPPAGPRSRSRSVLWRRVLERGPLGGSKLPAIRRGRPAPGPGGGPPPEVRFASTVGRAAAGLWVPGDPRRPRSWVGSSTGFRRLGFGSCASSEQPTASGEDVLRAGDPVLTARGIGRASGREVHATREDADSRTSDRRLQPSHLGDGRDGAARSVSVRPRRWRQVDLSTERPVIAARSSGVVGPQTPG
jgi:hypothetical protein